MSANKAAQKKLPPIKMRFKKREDITLDECLGMYELFKVYYQNTPFEQFLEDFSNKTGAHIAKRKTDGKVVGFSTGVARTIEVDGKPVRILFSGDTVMAKEYWGHSAFPQSFFRWLLSERLRHPTLPMYWFLISMGYRTYLILANNFYKYYPNIYGDDPHLKNVAFTAADNIFPGALNRETGLLDFGEDACTLSDFVTPITDKERAVPKIAFFESRNPSWHKGDEMACVGSLDWGSFGRVILDARRTLFKKGTRKTQKQASSAVVNHKPENIEVTVDDIYNKESDSKTA